VLHTHSAVAAEHEGHAIREGDVSGRLEKDLTNGIDVLGTRMLSVGDSPANGAVAPIADIEALRGHSLEQAGPPERSEGLLLAGRERTHAARDPEEIDRGHRVLLSGRENVAGVTDDMFSLVLVTCQAGTMVAADLHARHTRDVTTAVPNPSAAPGDLELVRGFVNTLDIEAGSDALASSSDASAWQREQGWPAGLGRSEHRELLRLREALRDLVSAKGTPAESVAGRSVDAVARRHPVVVRVTTAFPLAPSSQGAASAFVERILALVAAARVDGTWDRLKACANDGCRWLFYDHSRNRSRTWCTMDLCGSRAKMRTYRRRARSASKARPHRSK
jgi:predicted RNA-binding Zn ribbon-like protein